MRARAGTTLLLFVMLSPFGCAGGRSRVDLHVTGAVAGVTQLRVVATDQKDRNSQPVTFTSASTSAIDQTLELGFDRSIHGAIALHVTALDAAAATLAEATTTVDVRPGHIVSAMVALGTPGADLGGANDLVAVPADLANADLSGAKAIGEACGPSDTCASGFCVDSVCCNRACDGQCEACNLSASRGTCSPVTGAPVGGRTACTSDGPTCGGTCNGIKADACTYPTVACRAASCTAGMHTDAASCSNGTCPLTQTACALKSCDADKCMTVTQIEAGGSFTCALMSDKTVRCWGDNTYGQLGTGETDTTEVRHPAPAVSGLLNVKTLKASAQAFVCAIIGDGSVQCWGQNNRGQLGTGEDPTSVLKHGAPHAVAGLAATVSNMALGYAHACALVGAGGNVQCWGRNIDGQIGNSTSSPTTPVLAPTYVCAPGSTGGSCTKMSGAIEVGAGAVHSCATLTSNKTYCWGSNQEGQLAAGYATDLTPHPDPVQWGNVDYGHKMSNGVKQNIICALSGSTSLICSGDNSWNQLGEGTASDMQTTLYFANSHAMNELATGATFSCGLFVDRVSCWGQNDHGQLGIGAASVPAPLYPSDLTAVATGAVAVSAGNFHACALMNDGTVLCWGQNDHGQLGNDSIMDSSVPIAPNW